MRKWLWTVIALTVLAAQAPTARADDKDARAIIEKSIKAHGGEEKLAAVKAYRMKFKGAIDIMGMSLDFTMDGVHTMKGKMRHDIHLSIMGQNITVTHVYNGEKGWMNAGGNTTELDGDLLKQFKEEAHHMQIETLVPLRDKKYSLSTLGEIKVNGKAAQGVKVAREGFRDVELYFDPTSWMVVKMNFQAFDEGTMKEVAREIFLSDFKEANGVKYAARMIMHQDGKKFMEGEVTEQKYLDAVDDSEFAKP